MPFLQNKSQHRRYPYGPGAGFAIGSGERLGARRRETAQTKAFKRRYPGISPPTMHHVAGRMFGTGQSRGQMNGFDGLRQAVNFSGYEADGQEDSTLDFQNPFSQNQQHVPFTFAPSGGQRFGRQPRYCWPDGDFREGLRQSHSMRSASVGEDILADLYGRRQPEDDYPEAYDVLGARHYPHSFDEYHRGRFGPEENEPFRSHACYDFRAARGNAPFDGRFDEQPGRGGRLGPFPQRAPSHSWRGSPRDSYERLRPDDF